MKQLFSKVVKRLKSMFFVSVAREENLMEGSIDFTHNKEISENEALDFASEKSQLEIPQMKTSFGSVVKSISRLLLKYRVVSACGIAAIIVAIALGISVNRGINMDSINDFNYLTNSSDFIKDDFNSLNYTDSDEGFGWGSGSSQSIHAGYIVPLEPMATEPIVPSPNLEVIETEAPLVAVRGEHNDIIPEVQKTLMDLWYMDNDEPTDYFGSITEAAIRAFQRRNELEVTGELDVVTYNMLMSSSAKVYMTTLGDEGSDVEYIKQRLYELGYLEQSYFEKNEADIFDEVTYSAVIEFQIANNLDVDGKVGRETKEALYSTEVVGKMLKRGDRGEDIEIYQTRLKELGYLTTEPDGVYGKDTEMAVKRFQEQNSLIADGYLGPTTRELLMDEDARSNSLVYGMNGSDVLNVQCRLYELNYLRAKDITSYFTSITEKAVKAFQKNNGLVVDGKVGKITMNKLFSDDPVRSDNPVSPGNGGGGGDNGGGEEDEETRIDRFIRIARSKVGSRYVRGGKGPNVFDCSGFVYWCLNQAGISQGYMTSHMWANTTRYERNNDIDDVRRGDVIVYEGHVAIALGNWMMIDASQSKGKVVIRSFNSNYWHEVFICSFRIFR